MGREENIQVFEDTKQKCQSDVRLRQAIAQANAAQRLILETDRETWKPAQRYLHPAKISVSRKRTLEAASAYVGSKVCVLNFASATNPGGGVTRGSSAQEEAICRCSSLYFNLSEKRMWEGFYAPHRAQKIRFIMMIVSTPRAWWYSNRILPSRRLCRQRNGTRSMC